MIKKLLPLVVLLLPFFNTSAQIPVLVADIDPGGNGSNPICITAFNNNLYCLGNVFSFTSDGELWKFDGTNASKIILPNNIGVLNRYPFAVIGNKMFFNGPTPTASGYSLWYMDGTGTPIDVTDTLYSNAIFNGMAAIGQKLYFEAGAGLWSGIYCYDDANGTIQRKLQILQGALTVGPLDTINYIHDMVAYNNKLYFVGESLGDSSELFSFDPATGLASMVTTNTSLYNGTSPRSLFVGDNNKLYFSGFALNEGRELFVIDGNNAPQKVTTLNSVNDGLYYSDPHTQSYYKNIGKLGNYIYFAGNNGTNGYELMKLDLSNNTPSLVKNINTSTNSSYPAEFFVYQNRLYFSAVTDSFGRELWVTDGTASGTYMVADMVAGTSGSYPTGFTVFNNYLYFNGNDGFSGPELYRLSGVAGVESIKKATDISIYPNPATDIVTISLSLTNAENIMVTLTDATGKTVYSSPAQQCAAGANKLTVPVHQLPAGIYQYRIANAKSELIGAGNISHN